MKILVVIPARGGSKRLVGKNILPLGGKPLINWSIDIAIEISQFCDVLVSTDDAIISTIAKRSGAQVPWLRPAELASDVATLVDVAIHALDWYEENYGTVDGLLLLQPTTPFRSKAKILEGIELYKIFNKLPGIGVSPARDHPQWALQEQKGFLIPFIEAHGLTLRSQDLKPAFVPNGSFYLVSPKHLRSKHLFFGDKTVPLIITSQVQSLDIDTEWDYKLAHILLEHFPDLIK